MKTIVAVVLSCVLSASICTPSLAKLGGNVGDTAPDFPKGEFSDGGHYKIADYAGNELVVLFFYEQKCPTCRRSISGRNKIVKRFAGRPVKFFAIAAGDSLEEARAYASETSLAMPIFADKRSEMEKSYGIHISLRNIYQVRVIGTDGIIIAYDMDGGTIEGALRQLEIAKSKPETDPAGSIYNTAGSPLEADSSNMPASELAPTQTTNPSAESSGSSRSSVIMKEIRDEDGDKKEPNAAKRETAANLSNDAVAAMRSGNNALAVEKLKESIKTDPTYQLAKKNLQAALTNYGIDLINQDKLSEAEIAMREAFEMAKQLYSGDDPKVKDAADNYAGVLTREGKTAEANEITSKFSGIRNNNE